MKNNYLLLIACALAMAVTGCSKNDDDGYEPVSGVSVDLTKVPYDNLSEYRFFEGALKDQQPADGVLPYAPISALFTDYAHKKRFVWMPPGTKATFTADGKVLNLPVGAALIKTFYYDKVQNASVPGSTRIIETRIMIRKESGWVFANYVWNDQQTDAVYDMSGSFTDVTWLDTDMEGNPVERSAHYRIPSEDQCIVCHKYKENIGGNSTNIHVPIGIKPQNLNRSFAYADGTKNQLAKWVEVGYLDGNFAMPSAEHTTVDYNDMTQSLENRARSYVDINCAHCHSAEGHCDYRPMRFAFTETFNNRTNMGVCVPTQDMQGFPAELTSIISPGSTDRSMLYYRITTNDESFRMPMHGRTILHEEGIALMGAWINSFNQCP